MNTTYNVTYLQSLLYNTNTTKEFKQRWYEKFKEECVKKSPYELVQYFFCIDSFSYLFKEEPNWNDIVYEEFGETVGDKFRDTVLAMNMTEFQALVEKMSLGHQILDLFTYAVGLPVEHLDLKPNTLENVSTLRNLSKALLPYLAEMDVTYNVLSEKYKQLVKEIKAITWK
jgi:hypothetical protein